MFTIDLALLAASSKAVSSTSFGGVSAERTTLYKDWLKEKLREFLPPPTELPSQEVVLRTRKIRQFLASRTWETQLDQILDEVWHSTILMPEGAEHFAKRVSDSIIAHQDKANFPIYPIINSQWKSDAWLTGLFLYSPDTRSLNKKNIGFAVQSSRIPEPKQVIPLPAFSYDVLYIDDASYSGTQAFDLMNSISSCGLQPRKVILMFAGISEVAEKHIQESTLFNRSGTTAYFEPEISTRITTWTMPSTAQQMFVWFFKNEHIEVNPRTLKPQATHGEITIFLDITRAILPYKIPDSLSVPTHLYLAYDPDKKESVLESRGGHVFNTNGQVNYREIMASKSELFAQVYRADHVITTSKVL